MDPRQSRRERREAERKAKKLEQKKSRLVEKHPLSAVNAFPEIQPRWNPELEDEFPKEVQIRNNAMADLASLKAGLPLPPPGPSPRSAEEYRERMLARRKAAPQPNRGFVSQNQLPLAQTTPPSLVRDGHVGEPTEIGFVSQKPTRAEINRANAQHSTSPTSSTGKVSSAGNSLKHGLAAGVLLIPGEDCAAFASLLNDLLEEHQPATSTEKLLVEEMAQSHWLTQRAIRYQNDCFTAEGVNEKQLALFLRYQTTHHRAFYKALNTLLKLKKARAQTKVGFVSQQTAAPAQQIGFVSQNSAQPTAGIGFVSRNAPFEADKPAEQQAA